MKNDNVMKANYYSFYTEEQDVYGARWLYQYKVRNKKLYGDPNSPKVLSSYGLTSQFQVYGVYGLFNWKRGSRLPEDYSYSYNYYLYLRKFNVCENKLVYHNTSEIMPLLSKSFKVYSTGCSDIYTK